MPYAIRRKGGQWEVYNEDTGEVRGHTPTRKRAQRMIEAIYANTGEAAAKSLPADDTVVIDGCACKALDGEGRVGGYLVLFGDPDATDASAHRDFFTPETDFGLDITAKSHVWYHHTLDRTLGNRRLGVGAMKVMDAGVWIEAQLDLRDDYERKIYDAVKAGKMGWSSGTVNWLARYERQPNGSRKIVAWPLGLDASITPTPAEPRTQAVALKSLAAKLMAEGDDESGGYAAGGGERPAGPEGRRPTGTPAVRPGDHVSWGDHEAPGAKATVKAGCGTYKSGTGEMAEVEPHDADHRPAGGTMKVMHSAMRPYRERHAMKGAYLGDTDETLAAAAVDRLTQMLLGCLWTLVLSDQYGSAELVDHVSGALDEYKAAVVDAVEAFLGRESPGDDATENAAAAKSLLQSARDRLHERLSLSDHSESVRAAVRGLALRFDRVTDSHAAKGRPLSRAAAEGLKSLASDVAALSERAAKAGRESPPPRAEILRLQAEFAEFDARCDGVL